MWVRTTLSIIPSVMRKTMRIVPDEKRMRRGDGETDVVRGAQIAIVFVARTSSATGGACELFYDRIFSIVSISRILSAKKFLILSKLRSRKSSF